MVVIVTEYRKLDTCCSAEVARRSLGYVKNIWTYPFLTMQKQKVEEMHAMQCFAALHLYISNLSLYLPLKANESLLLILQFCFNFVHGCPLRSELFPG
ncbi:hypothetical protein OUZ56_025249 [Daphnia magna]|uniref:Uncharacterized protein n=1 Tax=Daphnia magna TaxID=35525 RepID=A0ABQ9ZJ97_9CRUS|nr:hypothetical protein OUZ56_025249 [Daphnia magna]